MFREIGADSKIEFGLCTALSLIPQESDNINYRIVNWVYVMNGIYGQSVAAVVILALAFFTIQDSYAGPAKDCESLRALNLPETQITHAENVPPGFKPPTPEYDITSGELAAIDIAFCRVSGVIAPAIHFEVWLPVTHSWNGRLQAVGNGGMAGSINYTGLKSVVENSYAGVSSDLGHQSGPLEGAWAIGRPDLVRDWGHRATHEMTVKAKALINAYYGKGPAYSYFSGCSGGGRQAMMQAQRYPEDFDGILAGDPTMDFSNLVTGGRLWQVRANYDVANQTNHLKAKDIQLISDAVIAACDAIDGVEDGVLEDPRQCDFDPVSIQCEKDTQERCLSPEQVAALDKVYQGARTSTGRQIYPGYPPGGELDRTGWVPYLAGKVPSDGIQWNYAQGFLQGLVFENPAYDILAFDYDKDVSVMNDKQVQGKALVDVINAADPDLRAFRKKGGKLIHYHGWNDIGISALRSTAYYEEVARGFSDRNLKHGLASTQDFYRLFLAPGMQHCFEGPGPNAFGGPFQLQVPPNPAHDIFRALERWVEHGIAPEKIIAIKYTDDDPAKGVSRTRPLCPYPQKSVYTGSGSTDNAQNFQCK